MLSNYKMAGDKVAQLTSGACVGALTGIIIGLSISQVVGIVLGALTALLAVYFGLKDGGGAENIQPKYKIMSIFGTFCLLFLFTGVYMRTHGLLSPSIKDQIREWMDAGYTLSEAKAIVLAQETGLSVDKKDNAGGVSVTGKPALAGNMDVVGTVLMAAKGDHSGFICDHFRTFADLKSAFENGDTTFRKIYQAIREQTSDTARQWQKLIAVQTLYCNN